MPGRGESVVVTRLPDCDVHAADKKPNVQAHYDGKTIYGPWAYMCEECYTRLGVGLGTGKGQMLILARPDPR